MDSERSVAIGMVSRPTHKVSLTDADMAPENTTPKKVITLQKGSLDNVAKEGQHTCIELARASRQKVADIMSEGKMSKQVRANIDKEFCKIIDLV